jgi:type VI secretion system secreted protein Hcp
MALEAFLKIEGIPGESRKAGHPDEIDILSFSFGASNPTTVAKGSGAGASQVSISSFNIMKMTDLASTALFLRCAKGEHIPEATVTLRKAGGTKPLEYLTYKFSKVYVENIQWSGSSGGDDSPAESLSLAFEKVEIVYSQQADDGTPKKTVGSGWDIPSGTPSGVK